MIFILEPNDISRELARKQVSVCEYPDGRLEIRHEGMALPYRVFDKLRRVNQAAIVDHKQLGAVLAVAREMQALRGAGKRNNDEPSRRAQPQHMFPTPAPDDGQRLAAAFALAKVIEAAAPPKRPQRRPRRSIAQLPA